MQTLCSIRIPSVYGEKTLSVVHEDATTYPESIDILVFSAFERDYYPANRTLIWGLQQIGIDVNMLSQNPEIDLRDLCGVWLSRKIPPEKIANSEAIGRLACVEFPLGAKGSKNMSELALIRGISALFRMLDIAAISGIPTGTIVLPLIATGNQGFQRGLVLIPLLREMASHLMRSKDTNRIVLIERRKEKAEFLAEAMSGDSFAQTVASLVPKNLPRSIPQAFISYSHNDESAVETLCNRLESSGVKTWYAKRDIKEGLYAERIVEAIEESHVFIPVISHSSMESNHVLSEVNLAFNRLSPMRRMLPLIIEPSLVVRPAFEYYLNAFECASIGYPFEDQLFEEFLSRVKG